MGAASTAVVSDCAQGTAPIITVAYANRHPGQFNSIEELFQRVAEGLPEDITTMKLEAPRSGVTLGSVLANLQWTRSIQGADLVHLTGDIHYAILAVRRLPAVLTIHDLRFIEEARGLKRLLLWWFWLYLPVLRADRVTVISEFTRGRLTSLCRIKMGKVRVIPNCIAPEFASKSKPWPTGRVSLLQVGTTPNKNLERLAEACAGLPIDLVILGEPSEGQRRVLDMHGLCYQAVTGLTRSEVVALYERCDLVVFVSTYEGFGMPILEGQAVGRPVLTSDLSPMREVAGKGALMVDPYDAQAIRAGLEQLMEDGALRERLVEEGFANVARYTAEAVASDYAAVYREVVASL